MTGWSSSSFQRKLESRGWGDGLGILFLSSAAKQSLGLLEIASSAPRNDLFLANLMALDRGPFVVLNKREKIWLGSKR